jgi:hypothetical protein
MDSKLVSDIAEQMGIKLSKVHLIDGKTVGCKDFHNLLIVAKGCEVGTLIYQEDLTHFKKYGECNRLETKIRESLSRLQKLIDHQ